MDRRAFIAGGSAVAAIATLPATLPAAGRAQQGGDAALNALFDRIFAARLDASPETTSSLGFDKDARAGAKRLLDDGSPAALQRDLATNRRFLVELEAVPAAGLSPAGALNREIILYSLRQQIVPGERFGLDSVLRPYRIFQQGGAWFSVPDFLNDTHVIATKADADAYVARLQAFAGALDQDLAVQRAQAARGIVAPDFALDLTIAQMRRLIATPPAQSNLVQSLVRRTAARGIAGDWATAPARIVQMAVYPAIARQIALLQRLRGQTKPGAGVWRLPQGDAIYAAALAQATTTTLSPEEVHRMGLAQVAEITAALDGILRGQGMTQGSVGARLGVLNKDPAQLYPDTAEGKAALIASLNAGIRDITAKLPAAFSHVSSAPLEIRAVPAEIQDGASNGYYKRAALDGSRPAIYFINLKEVADWPKYSLPALTFHEGLPGHHLQISLSQESTDIPLIRKIGFFGAYTEGWALYAEQLADELHGYANPLEQAGYLQSFLFRAVRLVVDTGIHTRRWTREQATAYMVETIGTPQPRSQREVERYCTQPGQACSYKVGHMAWTKARADAEAMLGAKFDIRRFHEVLKDGAMPLTVMQRLVAERARAQA